MSATADVWAGEESDECKITLHPDTPFSKQSAYWREYLKVCKIVGSRPQGITLKGLVDEIAQDDVTPDGSDPRYQRIRRFVSENPKFFDYDRSAAVSSVRPQLPLISLIFGGIIQNPSEKGYTPGIEWAEDMLKSVRPEWDEDAENINWNWGEKEKWHLTQAFRDYVQRINKLQIILQATDTDGSAGPDYIAMDYKTRFNDSGRVNKQFSIMNKCLEAAADDHETAIFVTLTTQPSRFNNLHESIAKINKNWNRFMSWISTDSRLGYRPQYTKVLEFQDSGNPHIHAIVFLEQENDGSMPWLVPKSDLDDYWTKWQGGYVNDMQALVFEDDLHDGYNTDSGWVKWDSDGDHGGLLDQSRAASDKDGYQTAGQYLGKYLSATFGAIKELGDPENETFTVSQEGDEEGRYEDKADPWKIALYWATRRKIKTVSRDLRDKVELDEDDDVTDELLSMIKERRYQVVGAYTRENMPYHIRNKMRSIDEVLGNLDADDPARLGKIGSPTSNSDPPPVKLEDELVGNLM